MSEKNLKERKGKLNEVGEMLKYKENMRNGKIDRLKQRKIKKGRVKCGERRKGCMKEVDKQIGRQIERCKCGSHCA